MKRHVKSVFLLPLLIGLLVIAACSSGGGGAGNAGGGAAGTANSANDGAANANGNAGGGAAQASDPTGGANASQYPRTIAGATGDVTLEKQPERVALVHWGMSDALLVFDLDSVALALPFTEQQSVLHTETYKPYVDKIGELAIIGENTEVNMERLLAYEPDLIIAGSDMNQAILGQLEKMAQTYVVDEQKLDVWNDWASVVTLFGELLGQEEAGAQYLADFDDKVSKAREALASVQGNVAFLQIREKVAYLQGTDYMGLFYDDLGLQPPDLVAVEGVSGEISLEGLSELDPDHLFLGYFNYSDPSLPAVADEWKQSGVWQSLTAVKNNQVHELDGQLGYGYGPIGRAYAVDEVVNGLQAP